MSWPPAGEAEPLNGKLPETPPPPPPKDKVPAHHVRPPVLPMSVFSVGESDPLTGRRSVTPSHGGECSPGPLGWWRHYRNPVLVATILGVYCCGWVVGGVATAGAVWLQYKEDDSTALGRLDIFVAFAYWLCQQCFWLGGVRAFALAVRKPRPVLAPGSPSYGSMPHLYTFDANEEQEGASLYTKFGQLPSVVMVGVIQLCAIMSRLSQNCFFFAHSQEEHADARVIYLQLLCGCLSHLGCLQVALWMIQESHETARLIERRLQLPFSELLHTLPEVRQLNSRHASTFQFAFTSLCLAACLSAIWTTRNFLMSADSSILCLIYLLFPSLVDGSLGFVVAVNCALPNTQIANLRQRLCFEYQAPGWSAADAAAWPIVRQRFKGLAHKGYDGLHVFGQSLTLGALTNIMVGVGSFFGALIGLLSYVASRSPNPGLHSCQSIPECTAGGWRKVVPVCLLMALAVLLTELAAMRVVRGTIKRRMGVPKLPNM